MRILAAQLNPTIGDIEGNVRKIKAALDRARQAEVDIVIFPELTVSGYPPEDLLLDPSFIDAIEKQIEELAFATKGLLAVIGLPRWNPSRKEKPLYNSAAIFRDGQLIGFHNKMLLPTYDVFDERRYFEPGEEPTLIEFLGRKIAITICEDLWQHTGTVGYTKYKCDPLSLLQEREVDLILNLSSSPYDFKHKDLRISVFAAAAKALQAPLILCNEVGANDQLVFDGHSFYLNEKGELIQLAKGFAEDDLLVDLSVHACPCSLPQDGLKDLYDALVLGVRDYFHKQGFQQAIVGLSGGIDSALTTCIAVDALGASNISALNLRTRFSSSGSVTDAEILARRLGIDIQLYDIDPIFQAYLDRLEPHFENRPWDIAEENLQSRIRGMMLMAHSNKFNSLVLTTGNKSEMAMGYTTLYGDMCGALGVLQDVTKSRVYQLARHVNREREIIPLAIFEKHPSPELKANQATYRDALPHYEILDPIIEDYLELRLSAEQIAVKRSQPLSTIADILHRIHLAEYKRRQAPIGIRVTPKAFSKGRNVPIVQKWK